jgi:hypothetical protein
MLEIMLIIILAPVAAVSLIGSLGTLAIFLASIFRKF